MHLYRFQKDHSAYQQHWFGGRIEIEMLYFFHLGAHAEEEEKRRKLGLKKEKVVLL